MTKYLALNPFIVLSRPLRSVSENYELLSPQDVVYEPSLCPTGLLSVDVGPIIRLDNSNLLPHIELNISVAVYEHADLVTIRLQCLYAPDAEDIYCHDVLRMMDGNQWLWPCRSIVFSKNVALLPFHFGYSCFRMFGLSQYMINVTVFPQYCRATLVITSPTESQLSPDIAMYYSDRNMSDPDWSPLLIVDLSEKDGVWLRVERPPSYYARLIAISIFERHNDGVLRSVQTVNVVHPSTGYKWRDVPKGDYVAYAHIPRHDCVLICDEEFPSTPVSCRICKHTVINFTVAVDRASVSWMRLRRMRDSSPSILLALACVVVAFALCGIIYVLALRRRVRHTPIQVQEMELHEKPSILLLTPDDCAQHSTVVHLLGRLLEKHLGVTVLLDDREMSNSVIRPYNWIVDSICRASHVLIIISPCSQLVLNGQHLQQRRPFPDLFVPAISMIMREYTKSVSSNKYIICRLPYSPPTCNQLSILGFPEVELPLNLARLTALIHSVDAEVMTVPADCPVLDELMQAVGLMMKLMETNKDWIQRRLNSEDVDDAVNLADVPVGHELVLQTNKERTQAAEKFGLLPPEETEVVESHMEFALLPPDSSDED
ncbi:hypothetical protein KIN20_032037 [Parelaphostrongylus tenuis]|uniref:SEFIR domain-containing protein n=1 Tax=Parelaphostrongylus tenuis TaxID=148309 RepID=A0AAD5R5Z2_PARTN|nr:hypothetical protein KIN20_032037 [Parelaphostrongylus tenuis]